ncbi:hypothetical protein PGT21_035169 [Puccinia graminis f. sp. tritici]|uniref:Uncharacterized protein n=1 Tax=Puccinia graminis f. sp. tritici TaxID=56615 RepID=A0A5B0N7L5_PUCGR|nr:hypothetical protein PGT21_035169 [Puccinia graminis f. sp. tritici]
MLLRRHLATMASRLSDKLELGGLLPHKYGGTASGLSSRSFPHLETRSRITG